MASERGRIVMIFVAVAAVIGGGAFYFFKVYQPKQARQEAQDEVVAWETKWTAARDCLLGPKPASSKTSEALAIREMSPDPWNRGGCTPLISKLSRGDAPQTGIAEIEEGWNELDHAASKAAQAFATHVGASTTLTDDPLPAALDRLDSARTKLRVAAGLPPSAQGGKPLPAAEVLPIKDGADPITKLEIEALPSAHGMVVFARTASREVQVNLTVGSAPQVGRVGPGAVRSIPDGGWGATAGEGEVRAGAFDVEGAMPAATTIPLAGTKDVAVAAAGGTLADGVVVYGGDQQLAIAHAHASAITADSPLSRIATGVTGTDGDGRIALVWVTADREEHARILKPGGDEPLVELTEVVVPGAKPTAMSVRPSLAGTPCLTADRAWIMFGAIPIVFGGGKPATKVETDGTLIGCTPEAAVFRTGVGAYAICTDTCRSAQLAAAPEQSAVTVVGGKLVAIEEHGGVLAVWREGAPVTYYGLPQASRPVLAHEWAAMAMTNGKVIDLVARGDKTFTVVRIPAT